MMSMGKVPRRVRRVNQPYAYTVWTTLSTFTTHDTHTTWLPEQAGEGPWRSLTTLLHPTTHKMRMWTWRSANKITAVGV